MRELGKDIRALWDKSDKNAVKSILFVTLVVTLYFYFGISDFFAATFQIPTSLIIGNLFITI